MSRPVGGTHPEIQPYEHGMLVVGDGDLVYYQPHAAPGIYARAFVEGRLGADELANFRRQLQPVRGLSGVYTST